MKFSWFDGYLLQETDFFKVWFVPDRYLCNYGDQTDHTNACNQDGEIPCWVSRPMEKTIIVLYMVAMQIFCIVIGIVFI